LDRSKFIAFGNLELLANQVVEGFVTGMHKSPFHGFSVEFAEHRIYNQGESTKNIDWKLYGRTDRFYTKKYEEETNLRCQILIDCSKSMYFPIDSPDTKIRHSIYAAASVIELLRRQRDAFGVTLFDKEILLHTASKASPAHQRFVYSEIEKYLKEFTPGAHTDTHLASIMHEVAEIIPRRSMVVIFTDFWSAKEDADAFYTALNHLKHAKHEVVVFHVFSRKYEETFGLDNRPYQLIDMESGETIRILPNDYRNNYIKNVETYLNEIKIRCGNIGVDFTPVAIEDDYHQIMIQYLIKRQKLMQARRG